MAIKLQRYLRSLYTQAAKGVIFFFFVHFFFKFHFFYFLFHFVIFSFFFSKFHMIFQKILIFNNYFLIILLDTVYIFTNTAPIFIIVSSSLQPPGQGNPWGAYPRVISIFPPPPPRLAILYVKSKVKASATNWQFLLDLHTMEISEFNHCNMCL